jgi:hypothetical protein
MGTSESQPIDAAIAARASRHHGNVTQAQLTALGLSAHGIEHRIRRGRLFRVHYGVFAVGRPPVTPLERASAAVLACGPDAALSHLGALALWGFITEWPPSFDAIVVRDRRPAEISTHRCKALLPRDIRVQLGIRATSPARTLLDCGPLLEAAVLTRVVNGALHTPYLTREQLADVCRRFPRHPGARRLHPFVGRSDGATRSALEDEFQSFCARYGLPVPVINTRVAGHEVDALFPAHRLIVELDGWEFHRDRQSFESDRDRDADTLAAGHATVRITHARLHEQPAAEAQRLGRILQARG